MNNNRRTVLSCIDGSHFSSAVVDYTAWIASRVKAPVKLLHNIEHTGSPHINLSGSLALGEREELLEELTELESRRNKILREQGKLMLDSAHRRLREAGVVESEMLQRHGSLVDSLIDLEEETRVLVLGVRGEAHENQEAALGSQLEPVIRAMHRPVLVVNRPFEKAPERLMIAYDGRDASRKALDMVAMSPLYEGLDCHLVQVGANSGSDKSILSEGVNILEKVGMNVTGQNLTGDIEAALLDYQDNHHIDLIVMGAFGHSRLREVLFGSMTLKMLSHSSMPLLLLR